MKEGGGGLAFVIAEPGGEAPAHAGALSERQYVTNEEEEGGGASEHAEFEVGVGPSAADEAEGTGYAGAFGHAREDGLGRPEALQQQHEEAENEQD